MLVPGTRTVNRDLSPSPVPLRAGEDQSDVAALAAM